MQNQQVNEGNLLIAQFMDCNMPVSELTYNVDWNGLIPVIDKIEKMGFITAIHHDEDYTNYMYHFFDKRAVDGGGKSDWLPNRIEAAWQAIINFINWYNGRPQ